MITRLQPREVGVGGWGGRNRPDSYTPRSRGPGPPTWGPSLPVRLGMTGPLPLLLSPPRPRGDAAPGTRPSGEEPSDPGSYDSSKGEVLQFAGAPCGDGEPAAPGVRGDTLRAGGAHVRDPESWRRFPSAPGAGLANRFRLPTGRTRQRAGDLRPRPGLVSAPSPAAGAWPGSEHPGTLGGPSAQAREKGEKSMDPNTWVRHCGWAPGLHAVEAGPGEPARGPGPRRRGPGAGPRVWGGQGGGRGLPA